MGDFNSHFWSVYKYHLQITCERTRDTARKGKIT